MMTIIVLLAFVIVQTVQPQSDFSVFSLVSLILFSLIYDGFHLWIKYQTFLAWRIAGENEFENEEDEEGDGTTKEV